MLVVIIFGIGMTLFFMIFNPIISYFTADEDASTGRIGDERQQKIKRQAVVGSWGSILYYIVMKMIIGLPLIESIIPKSGSPLLSQEMKNTLLINQGSDTLFVAIIGYTVFYLLAQSKFSSKTEPLLNKWRRFFSLHLSFVLSYSNL